MQINENRLDCFVANFPECLGKITKCPNLINCHNQYAGIESREAKKNKKNKVILPSLFYIVLGLPLILILLFEILRWK